MSRRLITVGARLCLGLALAGGSGGCTVAGVLWYNAFGDPPVHAQYELPKVPTLVLVENHRNASETQADADVIARAVSTELKDRGGYEIVSADKLVPLREEDAAKFQAMNTDEIGRAVGAKQVVYVDLVESDIGADPSGGAVHSKTTARIKVVDVEKGKTAWPLTDAKGLELTAKRDYDRYDSAGASNMRADTFAQLSSKIAKLFYTWKPDNQQEETDGG